ncbi:type 1 glutamine amidotransferase [Marinovum sp.]|uniref:type 1 glutamine amidotransferase n=1 Tax=Marinovum sp. TaxID=2024839 RepID=UPI002B275FB6|nr:type 1 glutamine amidotransferase [Marinovum sp.]
MKIGILTTGHRPEALPEHKTYSGMFRDLLDGQGFDFDNYDVVDGEMPGSVRDADGWLITGSKHGAYEDLPWIAPLEALIREAHAADIPVVGICFGHQILAQALGGTVEKFTGGWSVGRVEYDFGGEMLPLYAWHQDQVTARPEGAEVVARTDFCENAGLVYGGKAFSVQPHPEFTSEFLSGLMDARGEVVPPDMLAEARATVDRPVANDRLGAMIGQFFRDRSLA